MRALRAGVASGAFAISHPDYMANVLWTPVSPDQVVRTCVASALATVGAARSAG